MSNRKLINVVRGDINSAIERGTYTRDTTTHTNIEFDTKDNRIMLDGVPHSNAVIKVTWLELKNLRDNSELKPGSFNDEEALMPSEVYIEDSSYAIIDCNGYGTQVIGFVPKDTVFTTYGIYLHGKKVLVEN